MRFVKPGLESARANDLCENVSVRAHPSSTLPKEGDVRKDWSGRDPHAKKGRGLDEADDRRHDVWLKRYGREVSVEIGGIFRLKRSRQEVERFVDSPSLRPSGQWNIYPSYGP